MWSLVCAAGTRLVRSGRLVAVVAAVAIPATVLVPAGASAVPTLVSPGPALASTADTSWWGTNGRVNDIVVMNDRVYLGGAFDIVGPQTGHGSLTDPTTGVLNPGNKVISGDVSAAIQDGAGGWFLGGTFRTAGVRFRANVVRLAADGTVLPFSAQVSGSVSALALTSNGLLIGGKFTAAGGAAATNLAMVDPETGARVTSWNASANAEVKALAVDGQRVFVGGLFTTLNGKTRRGLGAVSVASGATDAFPGVVTANVYALAVDSSSGRVYVGGDFGGASSGLSQTRTRLASFDLASGSLTSWNPGAQATVFSLVADQAGTVYVGGAFTSIGGQARNRLAAVTSAGVVTGFDAAVTGCFGTHTIKYANGFAPCTPVVRALALAGDSLYVGGLFSQIGGQVRHNAGAVDVTTGLATQWDPRPSNLVYAVGVDAQNAVVGGEQTSVNGEYRKGMAALDAASGALDAGFQADTDEAVLDMLPSVDGTRLIVGGSFLTIQGASRPYLASINVASGQVDGFKPRPNKAVLAMDAVGSSLYLGGKFTKVGGTARLRAAKLDVNTGAVDPQWIANTNGPSGSLRSNGMVEGIQAAPDESKVYLAGPFTSINGSAIPQGIAVLGGSTSNLLPNQLSGVEACGSIGPWINRLYLSDDGQRLYGGDVCPDHVYQWDAVNLSSPSNPTGELWETACNGGAQGLLEVNGHFYYGSHGGDRGRGGWCLSSPTGVRVDQQRFFVFSADDATLYSFAPEFDTAMGIWAFAELPGRGLLVGGDFTFAGTRDTVARGVAFFPGTP